MRRSVMVIFALLSLILFCSTAHAQKPVYGGSLAIAQAVEPPGTRSHDGYLGGHSSCRLR